MWLRLVLVASPARLLARRSGDRSVCYELLSVSTRDENGDADRLGDARRSTRGNHLAHSVANTQTGRLLMIDDHTLRFWNLSGTF